MRGHYVSKSWASDPTLYAPAKYRKACKYDAFVPASVADFNDALPAELAGVVSDAEAAIRSLNDRARPALKPFARLLLRTESIASSKVEGLQVNAKTLARAEANTESGKTPGADVAEVLRNVDAMELAVDETSAVAKVSVAHLLDIHRVLMSGAANEQIAGRIRDTQNWIGGNDYNPCGADFVPPPPEQVDALLVDLERLVGSEHLPPLVQAAIVHAQFETIHPFEDGNGRTGRALIHVVLRRRGITPSYVPPISVLLAADRNRYIDALSAYREGDLAGWIEYFAASAAQAALLAERYLTEVADLKQQWKDRLSAHGSVRSDSAAWAVIDELPGFPVISLPVATAVTGRSKSSTAVALGLLVEAEILLPLSESKRNRAWEANGLLDLLASADA